MKLCVLGEILTRLGSYIKIYNMTVYKEEHDLSGLLCIVFVPLRDSPPPPPIRNGLEAQQNSWEQIRMTEEVTPGVPADNSGSGWNTFLFRGCP